MCDVCVFEMATEVRVDAQSAHLVGDALGQASEETARRVTELEEDLRKVCGFFV